MSIAVVRTMPIAVVGTLSIAVVRSMSIAVVKAMSIVVVRAVSIAAVRSSRRWWSSRRWCSRNRINRCNISELKLCVGRLARWRRLQTRHSAPRMAEEEQDATAAFFSLVAAAYPQCQKIPVQPKPEVQPDPADSAVAVAAASSKASPTQLPFPLQPPADSAKAPPAQPAAVKTKDEDDSSPKDEDDSTPAETEESCEREAHSPEEEAREEGEAEMQWYQDQDGEDMYEEDESEFRQRVQKPKMRDCGRVANRAGLFWVWMRG